MMTIVYSFNKRSYEADYWSREIAASSDSDYQFIPFNHSRYLDPELYRRAQLLDGLYHDRHPGLMSLYSEFAATLRDVKAEAVIVDNYCPYHPEFLRTLPLYKVLRIADGPIAAYDRDFAYLHAYHHVLYHSPAYSADLGMAEKLRYCRATITDFWPLALFDACFDGGKSEESVFSGDRDIDVLFIGALHLGKMPFLARVRKALGRRCKLYGVSSLKRNVYFNLKYGFPGWIRPVGFEAYVPMYQRTKIGFNVHNRGDYTVGSYRLFELPANGVMQISDGGVYLNEFFRMGDEIVGYSNADDLIDKIRYYLAHDEERVRIAVNGYRRVMKDHRLRDRMNEAGRLIQKGMQQIGWQHENRR